MRDIGVEWITGKSAGRHELVDAGNNLAAAAVRGFNDQHVRERIAGIGQVAPLVSVRRMDQRNVGTYRRHCDHRFTREWIDDLFEVGIALRQIRADTRLGHTGGQILRSRFHAGDDLGLIAVPHPDFALSHLTAEIDCKAVMLQAEIGHAHFGDTASRDEQIHIDGGLRNGDHGQAAHTAAGDLAHQTHRLVVEQRATDGHRCAIAQASQRLPRLCLLGSTFTHSG